MLKVLKEKHILLTGIDSGNNRAKVSFLNEKGEIESFYLPTIISVDAPTSKTKLEGYSKERSIGELMLHVRITSPSLPDNKTTAYYYVGAAAQFTKDPEKRIEAKGVADKKLGNELHVVSTLTALAVSAFKTNRDVVNIPYSGGLPIEEYKKSGTERVLDAIRGTHEIEVIDGDFEGQRVQITIDSGYVHVEGITSTLALSYDLKKGEIVETDLNEQIGEHFALADLGAGTLDLALYDESGLNKDFSTNTFDGTNSYIDQMINDITNLEDFKELRQLDPEARPYVTREEFLRKVIFPVVDKMVKSKKMSKPTFVAEWSWVKSVDVTDIVLNHMKEYTSRVMEQLKKFWVRSRVSNFVLVGGGLLFGYYYFKNEETFIFPPVIEDSPFYTSRAYLIANYLKHLEKLGE